MVNDSAAAGYLLPESGSAAPLEGQSLNQFLQAWLVGLTGIDPTLVRPRWQSEPANIPQSGDYWVAFGITEHVRDSYPIVQHNPAADDGNGNDTYMRHERLDLMTSFYDTGVNGMADYYASLFVDGVQIGQNLSALWANGFNFYEASSPTPAPSLLKERWLYRVDVKTSLKRQVRRTYAVRNVEQAQAAISDGTIVVPVITGRT